MRLLWMALAGTLCGPLCTTPARAQRRGVASLEINLDNRAYLPTGGRAQSALYSGAVGFHARLAPNLRFDYHGAQNNAPTLTGAGARFDKFITQQATLEVERGGQAFQLGIVRLPFGLHDSREMYASGLIDYPLLRSDFLLDSVTWGVPGVRFNGGTPDLQAQAALFGGQASGIWGNRNNIAGAALRLQTFHKDFILGMSRWDGTQSASFFGTPFFAPGRQQTHLTGVDLRYTRPHLLIRGEALAGKLGGQNTQGWHLDFHYRLPKYERWTMVARLEEFSYALAAPHTTRQVTTGFRYTLDRDWLLAVNWRKNNKPAAGPSWTPASGVSGDFFFQLYRKINL